MELFLIFLLSAIVIYFSSIWIVKAGVQLSKLLGLSTFTFGLIFISLSTSLPDLFVGIFSALGKVPAISIGEVIGANLFDLTSVLGLVVISASYVVIKRKEYGHLLELLFISSILPIILFQMSSLNIFHAGILFFIYFVYIFRLSTDKKSKIKKQKLEREKIFKTVAFFAEGVILLLLSTRLLVDSAVRISQLFNISYVLIGSTLVAYSSSLPELTVELQAVRKGEKNLALGDLFGSAITNMTLVLGTTIVVAGRVIIEKLGVIIPYLLISTMLIWYWVSKDQRITRKRAFLLLIVYLLFILSEVLKIG